MKQYLDLCRKVLECGHYKNDRTKTGTISYFGAQMRFDLSEGFPLLTTKRVHLKSIIYELLWFIKGDTNIKYLVDHHAKVILCSHLGKVKNGPNEGESLAPVAERLSEKLGKEVVFVSDYNVTGEAATKAVSEMKDGDVILLENTRYRAEETKNGEAFSKDLASLCDVYVNDAFGACHRAHCSTAGITKFVKTNVVGYLMQKEIEFLGNAVNNPVRPFVAILGGAKVADKLNVISNLLEKCDTSQEG